MNGKKVASGHVRKLCAYVVQDDVLYAFLTVKETLTLATHFYLPSSMSLQDKKAYVKDVINALGLAKAANTIIGDERVRGVSGGERKRVSVGVELISNPSLLFLDEPTSGLDSFQAQSVMGAMGSLARGGRTVVAAIHQPRSSIFDMIDVLVLVTEGRIVYAGKSFYPPLNSSTYSPTPPTTRQGPRRRRVFLGRRVDLPASILPLGFLPRRDLYGLPIARTREDDKG